MSNRIKLVLSLAVAASFVIMALFTPIVASADPLIDADTTTFNFAVNTGNAGSFDPAVVYETVGGSLIQNVYETLVWYDGESASDLVPMLAEKVPTVENGGISADGQTYRFIVRSGVEFSDGTPLTAFDVEYTFHRGLMLNDPNGPFWMYGQVLIPEYYDYGMATFAEDGTMVPSITQEMCDAAVYASDASHVQFNLTRPYAPFLSTLAFNAGSIVSKNYVEANGGLSQSGFDFMRTNMMGTGPFVLTSYSVDAYWDLVRNDNYWREPASLEHVIITQVPDDTARVQGLISGVYDAAEVPPYMRSMVDGVDHIAVEKDLPTFNMDCLALNQAINVGNANPSMTDVPSDFFTDVHVRKAFAHAFDYGSYITNAWSGMAIQPNGVIPQGMFGYSTAVPKYAYDLDAARAELSLAEDGRDGASGSYLDNGFSLELFYNSGNIQRQTACELLKVGLESLDPEKIKVTVTPVEWATYLELRNTRAMPIMFIGWMADYADPDDYMQPFYLSDGYYPPTIGYSNAETDAKIMAASEELDSGERASMYEELSMGMYDECVYIWLDQATSFHAQGDWVSGYYFNPMFSKLYFYPMSLSPHEVQPYHGASVTTWDAPMVKVGETATWQIEVTNTGTIASDVFDLSVSSYDYSMPWDTLTLSSTTVVLDPGQSAMVTATLKVPATYGTVYDTWSYGYISVLSGTDTLSTSAMYLTVLATTKSAINMIKEQTIALRSELNLVKKAPTTDGIANLKAQVDELRNTITVARDNGLLNYRQHLVLSKLVDQIANSIDKADTSLQMKNKRGCVNNLNTACVLANTLVLNLNVMYRQAR